MVHITLDGAKNDLMIAARIAGIDPTFHIGDASLEERNPFEAAVPSNTREFVGTGLGKSQR